MQNFEDGKRTAIIHSHCPFLVLSLIHCLSVPCSIILYNNDAPLHVSTELSTEAAGELLSAMQAEYPDHGLSLAALGNMLQNTVPKAISHRLTVDASQRERRAQTANILDAVEVATSQIKCVNTAVPCFLEMELAMEQTDAAWGGKLAGSASCLQPLAHVVLAEGPGIRSGASKAHQGQQADALRGASNGAAERWSRTGRRDGEDNIGADRSRRRRDLAVACHGPRKPSSKAAGARGRAARATDGDRWRWGAWLATAGRNGAAAVVQLLMQGVIKVRPYMGGKPKRPFKFFFIKKKLGIGST